MKPAPTSVTSVVHESPQSLRREIGWHDAFWLASGVPALVLFSIGGIAATVGAPSYIVWPLSVLLGFIQSFTYAEIAGMFPSKSGGASIYGAAAWIRYGKLFAPLSVWCNWLAWTPVLAIGCGIAAGYILNGVGPTGSALRGFELILLDLSALKSGLRLRIDAHRICLKSMRRKRQIGLSQGRLCSHP